MHILVFFDTPHQRRYYEAVREAFAANGENVRITCSEYGASGNSNGGPKEQRNDRVGLATWRHLVRKARPIYTKVLIPVRQIRAALRYLPSRSRVVLELFRIKFYRRHIEKILLGKDLSLVVIVEDNAQGLSGIVSNICTNNGIPYVIIPDFIPNPLEPAKYYFDDPSHDINKCPRWIRRLIAQNWIFEFSGKNLLRLPPEEILARKILGIDAIQPWILNAGYAERVLLESEQSKAHYKALGFRDSKLSVIGSPIDDKLRGVYCDREELRRSKLTALGMDPSKKVIVCGFPPDQYSVQSNSYEFRTFEELVSGWFQSLACLRNQFNILIVPHPRLDIAKLRIFEEQTMRVVDDELSSVLPISDLYVTCVSTTIRWALALGIPVINYDCYRYGYGDFSVARGVVEVKDRERFEDTLHNYAGEDARNDLKSKAKEDAGNWGVVDGDFSKRLRSELTAAVKDFKGPTPTH